MKTEADYIGTGWSFPPAFDREKGQVETRSGTDDIDESLHILLSTTIGERIMQPRYGCNLEQFVFEPITSSLQPYVRKLVEDAILYFEPRIRLDDVVVTVADGLMEIDVAYVVKSSNSRSNFVFPFYLEEGVRP